MNNLPEYHDAVMRDFEGTPADRAAIEELAKTQLSLLVVEWPRIKGILLDDSEVSIAFAGALKSVDAGKRIGGELKLSYSKKFKNEGEFITPDFDQPELFKTEKPARPSSMALVRRSGAVIDVQASTPEVKKEQKLLPPPATQEKPKKKAKKKGGAK